jgi:hypothetical protein
LGKYIVSYNCHQNLLLCATVGCSLGGTHLCSGRNASAEASEFSIFCMWSPLVCSHLHTRGLGQGPRVCLRAARLGNRMLATPRDKAGDGDAFGRWWKRLPIHVFRGDVVAPVVSAFVDAWSRNSHAQEHGVIAARRLPCVSAG